jgi:pectinesterase
VAGKTSAGEKVRWKYIYSVIALVLLMNGAVRAGVVKTIVVAKTGKADFRTIQGAINSLTDTAATPRKIVIKNGVYDEKIYIEKHNIILEGESMEGVIITQAIARDEWRCLHNDDWGVATINVDANDITLENLTVKNSFGFDWKSDITINCPQDTVAKEKKLRKDGHQMALRTMNATRLKAINCHFVAFGGDTVSPWNVEDGMFYFKDCVMEGGVDFYCPRGWAYAENCKFITHTGPAAIWHDGSKHEDSKTVLKNCSFEGYDGFKLGRFHRDAQFFLVNCVFADNMADEDIYLVKTTNVIRWGKRVYYFNCHRKSENDFNWHKDNFGQVAGDIDPSKIDARSVFGDRWQPTDR